jgi:hypothetical protein
MDAEPKNTKNCILMCEESYKLLQQEIAELRQAKEKAEAEVARLRELLFRTIEQMGKIHMDKTNVDYFCAYDCAWKEFYEWNEDKQDYTLKDGEG